MTIDVTSSLGDIVAADSRRGRVLEKFGLDYCCNGHRSLVDAAREAGVDVAEVVAAMNFPDPAPVANAPLANAALAHDIVDTHHAFMWEEMPRLQALVDKVAGVHAAGHPELTAVQALYTRAVAELDPHMTREERSVFPAITRMEKAGQEQASAELLAQINTLIQEHQVVGDIFKEINELTTGYAVPADACGSYTMMLTALKEMEYDLHEHIHKENNILFPQVLKQI